MKYGLEKEIFLIKGGDVQMIPKNFGLPYDESGVLLEARGLPFNSIREAVFSLMAEDHRIRGEANQKGYMTSDFPLARVTRDFQREVRRNYSKGLITFENMYDYKDNRHSQNEITAAVHISFTNPITKVVPTGNGTNTNVVVNGFFDFIKYVKALDKAFAVDIKDSKRNPGFYEVKADGRVEYRSLPSNIDLYRVINVIERIEKS